MTFSAKLRHARKRLSWSADISVTLAVAFVIFLSASLLVPSVAVAQSQVAPVPLPPRAVAQINALLAEKQARTRSQHKVDSQLLYGSRLADGRGIAGLATMRVTLPMTADGRVQLDVRADVTRDLLDRLTRLGAEITGVSARDRHIAVRAPLRLAERIAEVTEVTSVAPDFGWMTSRSVSPGLRVIDSARRPSRAAGKSLDRSRLIASLRQTLAARQDPGGLANLGTVGSEGDRTHRASDARRDFAVAGSGLKIGVLSDGVSGLADSQDSGNLGPVTVLAPGNGNEGTAMLEIIADLAPGAELYFATATGGITAFAQRIRDLRAAGCDIIVDDVFYFAETAFQDGQIGPTQTNGGVVIQAVKDVTASGALYFSSAGNSGGRSAGTSGTWEGDFVDGGAGAGPFEGRLHSFGTATFNTILSTGDTFNTLYWSDPLGASSNDYDLFLLDSAGSLVAASTNTQDGSQDPFEIVTPGIDGDRLVIVRYAGVGRYLHLSTNRGRLSVATAGQIHGHAATTAVNSFGVAATPACAGAGSSGPCTTAFTASSVVESFSSDGPRRIFYSADGSALTPGNVSASGGVVLQKPDITAADGVSTSVPGFSPFYGTSAAAPHAGAIAALVRSVNPAKPIAQVAGLLRTTAIDIHTVGWDRDAGWGILMAYAAVAAAAPPPPPPPPTGLVVRRSGPASAIATWNAAARATTYRLKVGSTAGGSKETLATVSGTSAALSGLIRGRTYYFTVSASNESGSSADSAEVAFVISLRNLPGDFDGDGRADLIVWRPSTGTWYWITSSTGYDYAHQNARQWGVAGDVPFVGDIDGDGRADLIVWRPDNGTWYWLTSSSGYDYASQGSKQWGNASHGDTPLLGDFDGDGRVDLTVWRASTGTWFWLRSSADYAYASQGSKQWGNASHGDTPLLGDIDGDGKADLTVWRASTGTWFWLKSSDAYDYAGQGNRNWGSAAHHDIPLLADLDGDGRAELIVWRPASGIWFWLTSSSVYNSQSQRTWGISGDVPMVK